MKFEKKLVILTGAREAKGCLRLERNAYGVRATLNCYHLPASEGYILGVCGGGRFERHALGDAMTAKPLTLDERIDLGTAHFVVFLERNGHREEVLYGTLNRKRLSPTERLIGFEESHEPKSIDLPAAATAQNFTYSGRQGIFQDIFPRIEQAYEDDAIAEVNYYAGLNLDEAAAQCGAKNAAAFSEREQAYIDGYRAALNRDRERELEQAAERVTPSDLQRGCIHSLAARANSDPKSTVLPPAPGFVSPADLPASVPQAPKPAAPDERLPEDERLFPDEPVLPDERLPEDERLFSDEPILPDERLPEDEQLFSDEPILPDERLPEDEQLFSDEPILPDERLPEDERILFPEEPIPSDEPNRQPDGLTGRPVFRRKLRPPYFEPYEPPRYSPHPIYEQPCPSDASNPNPDTTDTYENAPEGVPQTTAPADTQPVSASTPLSGAKKSPAAAQPGEKPGISTAAAEPIRVPDAASTAYMRQGRKLSFYEQVQPQLDELFQNGTPEPELEALMPYTKWVRVAYDADRYYLVGLIGDPVSYVCYGIPAAYTPEPPAELDGYCQWLPKNASKPEGDGYWLLYQDATTGESVSKIE